MPLDETFTNLAAFLNSLDAEGEQKFELSHSLVIICPDCGKNIAFRGRCPKCAGNSWIPAGHAGGIFERTKAQRLRRMISEEDVTLRGTAAGDVEGTGSAQTTAAETDNAGGGATTGNGSKKRRKARGANAGGETTAAEATTADDVAAAGDGGDEPRVS